MERPIDHFPTKPCKRQSKRLRAAYHADSNPVTTQLVSMDILCRVYLNENSGWMKRVSISVRCADGNIKYLARKTRLSERTEQENVSYNKPWKLIPVVADPAMGDINLEQVGGYSRQWEGHGRKRRVICIGLLAFSIHPRISLALGKQGQCTGDETGSERESGEAVGTETTCGTARTRARAASRLRGAWGTGCQSDSRS